MDTATAVENGFPEVPLSFSFLPVAKEINVRPTFWQARSVATFLPPLMQETTFRCRLPSFSTAVVLFSFLGSPSVRGGYMLTAGSLNFQGVGSATNAFSSTASGKTFAINGGTIDSTSGTLASSSTMYVGTGGATDRLIISSGNWGIPRGSDISFSLGTSTGLHSGASTQMGVLGLMAPWRGGIAATGCAAERPVHKRNAKPFAR